jgi:hypothetical protein
VNGTQFYYLNFEKGIISKYRKGGNVFLHLLKSIWRVWNHCPEAITVSMCVPE